MKVIFFLFWLICFLVISCTKDKALKSQENLTPVDTISNEDTTKNIVDSIACGNTYYNSLRVCYSYLDSVDCLDSLEFANILIGDWENEIKNHRLSLLCDTHFITGNGGVFRKGILMTSDSIVEYFSWYVNGACPPYIQENKLIWGSSDSIFTSDYYRDKGWAFIEFCANDFVKIGQNQIILKRI